MPFRWVPRVLLWGERPFLLVPVPVWLLDLKWAMVRFWETRNPQPRAGSEGYKKRATLVFCAWSVLGTSCYSRLLYDVLELVQLLVAVQEAEIARIGRVRLHVVAGHSD